MYSDRFIFSNEKMSDLTTLYRLKETPMIRTAYQSALAKHCLNGRICERIGVNAFDREINKPWVLESTYQKAVDLKYFPNDFYNNTCAFHPNGLMTAGGEGKEGGGFIRLWNTTTNKMEPIDRNVIPLACTFNQSGDSIFASEEDCYGTPTIKRIDLIAQTALPIDIASSTASSTVTSLGTKSDSLLATGNKNGRFQLLDVRTQPKVQLDLTPDTPEEVCNLVISDNGTFIAFGTNNGELYVWDTRHTHNPYFTASSQKRAAIKAISFRPNHPNSILFGTGNSDTTIYHYEMDKNSLFASYTSGMQSSGIHWRNNGSIVTSVRDFSHKTSQILAFGNPYLAKPMVSDPVDGLSSTVLINEQEGCSYTPCGLSEHLYVHALPTLEACSKRKKESRKLSILTIR